MGAALLLTGIGFLVLTLGGALRAHVSARNGSADRARHRLSGDSAREERAALGPPSCS